MYIYTHICTEVYNYKSVYVDTGYTHMNMDWPSDVPASVNCNLYIYICVFIYVRICMNIRVNTSSIYIYVYGVAA